MSANRVARSQDEGTPHSTGSAFRAEPGRGAPGALSRRQILHLLDEEQRLIVNRFCESEGLAQAPPPNHQLPWYLGISKDWALPHLQELTRLPAGHLLDVGASYGLIAGVAHRLGWRVTAVDSVEVPAYSGLRIAAREIRCEVANVCVDPLPAESGSVDAVLLSEVLEHLMYSPLPLFREIERVLRPAGVVLLSTPNPAALSRLVRLALGQNPLEPHVENVLQEAGTYSYRGLTFLANNRESKLWTYGEVRLLLERTGLQAVRHRYYGNTVPHPLDSRWMHLRRTLIRTFTPLLSRTHLGGGGLLVVARKPGALG